MTKDTPSRKFFPGYIVPALLGILVVINLVTRQAYWPRRGGSLAVFTDGWRVSGTILLEISLASGLFAWYILANDEDWEHLAQPIIVLAVLLAILGVTLFGYGFLV